MILAIDAYSYHRFFGHHYPGLETDPQTRVTNLGVIDRAHKLGAAGISLESCFFDDLADGHLAAVKARLDEIGMHRMWAWGHPRGLESGRSAAAFDDMIRHIEIARRLGATVMRICAGGRGTRPESWAEHRALLVPMLTKACDAAQEAGITLAVENHLDLYAEELRELIDKVGSDRLGICLDTANTVRMFENPADVAALLAPWVRATHVKDVAALRGDPRSFAFWPSVPLGEGSVDLPAVLDILDKAGYRGLLAIEMDYLHPTCLSVDAALASSVQTLKAMVQDLNRQPV